MPEVNTLSSRSDALPARPAVSVIITAYNVSEYIGEAIDSVLAQTFTNYELIIVNDGSQDARELERVLEPYRSRIVYIEQENRGLAAARNRGLEAARGQFVAFLDADDFWLPNYLEEQFEFMRSNNYDLVYADALLFGDTILAGRTFMETSPSEGEVTFRSLISGRCNVIGSGVVARKKPLFDVGLFDEQLRNSQDFDLWIRLVRHGARLSYQRKVLLHYRYRDGSLSGDEINRVARELRVLSKIESCYDLSSDERAEVSRAREKLEASLELEKGKQHLERGEFADALAAFRKAEGFYRSLKLRAAVLLLRVSPRLFQGFYRRRERKIAEKLKEK